MYKVSLLVYELPSLDCFAQKMMSTDLVFSENHGKQVHFLVWGELISKVESCQSKLDMQNSVYNHIQVELVLNFTGSVCLRMIQLW